MKRHWLVFALLAGLFSPAASGNEKVAFLRTPNGGIQPQAVVDSQGTLHLVYFQGNSESGNLFYVKRPMGESQWSQPIRVNSQEGTATPNGAVDCARIAMGKDGRLHVLWLNSNPTKYFYAQANKDGLAFGKQRNLMTQYPEENEVAASIAADGKGNVFVTWHDGAFSKEDERAVHVTRSADGGHTFSSGKRVNHQNTGVCSCCGLQAFTDTKDTLYISYRAAGNSVNRDMTLLKSTDGGESFSGKTIDKWELNACPGSTTAMAEGPNMEVVVAWETKGQIYYANVETLSEPVSAPGSPATRRKNPAIAVNEEGEVLLAWGEARGYISGGELHWQIFSARGKATNEKGKAEGRIPDFSLPAAVARSDGTFVVIY